MSRLDPTSKFVIFQTPNPPLIGWFLFTMLNLLWHGNQEIHHFFNLMSFGFIFTWAWLEITSGVNYFRRLLGVTVLIITIWLHL